MINDRDQAIMMVEDLRVNYLRRSCSLALAMVLCLLVGAVVCGVACSGKTAEHQEDLSEVEKAEAVTIALADLGVGRVLQGNNYEIDEVRLAEYGWDYKEESFSGILPAVHLVIGDRDLPGIDLVVYVDVSKKSVVHISEVYRRGPPPS